ncbi:DNA repair protein rhp55 [Madurella mycetomatis]|uniref:DNA repair protein RAD51 homolog 3 n=1 Tax=Madurella mycetomatis TaxID=100816 RepID=A0A175VPG4_9PEZI|nr:DNA repair protein rhp55 [Madurella mycetomatis]
MDYHAIHGHDVSSFDLSATRGFGSFASQVRLGREPADNSDRLPTVSAAKALQDLERDEGTHISTGLSVLDASLTLELDGAHHGGIQKGHVTEVWGPPGAGKTAFGCLAEGKGVVWVGPFIRSRHGSNTASRLHPHPDGFHRVPIERLRTVAGAGKKAGPDQLDAFAHYTCPSLPHLIALLCRPTAACIPQKVSLVVVDSLSALVNHAFPKLPETRATADAKGVRGPSLAARRIQVLQYIASSLQKLAATRDVAVVVLTQCATKMQAERGATLIPAINANVWEQGVSTRLVLFRDWLQDGVEARGLHFVGIQKLNGKCMSVVVDKICAFAVEAGGLVSVDYDNTEPVRPLSSTAAQKRKLADTDFEIADSDDEDYGWDDDEDVIPPMPSQWQGSEDLLLTRQPESEEEGAIDDTDAAGTDDGEGQASDHETRAAAVDGPDRATS